MSLGDAIKASLSATSAPPGAGGNLARLIRLDTSQRSSLTSNSGGDYKSQPTPQSSTHRGSGGHRAGMLSIHNSAAIAASRAPHAVNTAPNLLFHRARTAASIGGFTNSERAKFYDLFELVATEPPDTGALEITGFGSGTEEDDLLWPLDESADAATKEERRVRLAQLQAAKEKAAADARAAALAKVEADRRAKTALEFKQTTQHHKWQSRGSKPPSGAAAAAAAVPATAVPIDMVVGPSEKERKAEQRAAAAAAAELESKRKSAAAAAAAAASNGPLTIKKERFIQLLDKMDLLLTDSEQQQLKSYIDAAATGGGGAPAALAALNASSAGGCGPFDDVRLITHFFPAHFTRFDVFLNGYLERKDFLRSCADFASHGANIMVPVPVQQQRGSISVPQTPQIQNAAAAAPALTAATANGKPVPATPAAAVASAVPTQSYKLCTAHGQRFSNKFYDSMINRVFPDKIDVAAINRDTGQPGVEYRLSSRDYVEFMIGFVYILWVVRDVPSAVTFDDMIGFLSRELHADYTRDDVDQALQMIVPWPRLPLKHVKPILGWYIGSTAAAEAVVANQHKPYQPPPPAAPPSVLRAASIRPGNPPANSTISMSRSTRVVRTNAPASVIRELSDDALAASVRAQTSTAVAEQLLPRVLLNSTVGKDTDWFINAQVLDMLAGGNTANATDFDVSETPRGAAGRSGPTSAAVDPSAVHVPVRYPRVSAGSHTLQLLDEQYWSTARADPIRRGNSMLRHLMALKEWGSDPSPSAPPSTGDAYAADEEHAPHQTVADRKYQFIKSIHKLKHDWILKQRELQSKHDS